MARVGQTFSFVCAKEQVSRILRVIVYCNGVIAEQVPEETGIFITVRKA
jgi:hypothetical protein